MPQPTGTQPTKPNYNLNFTSVIGGRQERGLRAPGFGKRHVFLVKERIRLFLTDNIQQRQKLEKNGSVFVLPLSFV